MNLSTILITDLSECRWDLLDSSALVPFVHKCDDRMHVNADDIETERGFMIVTRWQAPLPPAPERLKMIFSTEGLEPFVEDFPPKAFIPDHRHPFDEVRIVVQGEMLFNIAGNQLLLRTGDRIDIPANTRHSKTVEGTENCVCLVAHRTF